MKVTTWIKTGTFALLLGGCVATTGTPPAQPEVGDDAINRGPSVYLNAIQVGAPEGYRTPIRVTLTVPNNCYRFMGGSVYSRGRGIVLDLSVSEGFHIGQVCAGPARISDVVAYPLAMRRGKAYRIRVVVNGRLVGDMTTVAGGPSWVAQPAPYFGSGRAPRKAAPPADRKRERDGRKHEHDQEGNDTFYGGEGHER